MHVSMDVSYNCIRGIRSILCPKYEHKLKWRRTSTEPASYQKCNSGQVSFIQHPRVLHVCITWVGNSCCFWQSQYSLKPMKRVANWLLKVCQQRIAHKPMPFLNPFHATDLFWYLPENIRKPLIFWCFQEVSKEVSGLKLVNLKENQFSYKIQISQAVFFTFQCIICWFTHITLQRTCSIVTVSISQRRFQMKLKRGLEKLC